jgi:hypothetical protein
MFVIWILNCKINYHMSMKCSILVSNRYPRLTLSTIAHNIIFQFSRSCMEQTISSWIYFSFLSSLLLTLSNEPKRNKHLLSPVSKIFQKKGSWLLSVSLPIYSIGLWQTLTSTIDKNAERMYFLAFFLTATQRME